MFCSVATCASFSATDPLVCASAAFASSRRLRASLISAGTEYIERSLANVFNFSEAFA